VSAAIKDSSSPAFIISLEHSAFFHIAILLAVALLLTWLFRLVNKKLVVICEKSSYTWDASLLRAIYKPLLILLWVEVIISIGAITFRGIHFFGFTFLGFDYLSDKRLLISLLLLFWFFMRFISYFEHELLQSTRKQKSFIKGHMNIAAIAKLFRVLLIVIVALMVIQKIGVPMGSLIAVGGLGTVTLGFAAKDTISNFFGGLMIFTDKPFEIGDWIQSPDREINGHVEYIGWRLTRVRSLDKRPVYVPNGIFSTILIENLTRMHNWRIYKSVGVRYGDATKVSAIVEDIEKMLRDHPGIDTRRLLMVNLYEFASSSLNILVYAYAKTVDWEAFNSLQHDILLKIIDIITSHGAECAFPSRTMYFADESNNGSSVGDNNE
jgi:MscS family membrane protein